MRTAPKLAPEVTADIVRRLRQAEPARRRAAALEVTTVSEPYDLPREDVEAAYHDGIFEIDRAATFQINTRAVFIGGEPAELPPPATTHEET